MKFLLVPFLFVHLIFFAQQESFDKGLQHIQNDNFSAAIEQFKVAIQQDSSNTFVYYNYGYAQFKNGNIGEAIWGFEKTLKLSPKSSDAMHNLKLCYSKLGKENYLPFRSGIARSVINFGSFNWAGIAVITSVLFAVSLFLYATSKNYRRKKVYFILAPFLLIAVTTTVLLSIYSKSCVEQVHFGIATAKTATYSNTKGAKNELQLSIGARFQLLEKLDGKYAKVILNNGREVIIQLDKSIKLI